MSIKSLAFTLRQSLSTTGHSTAAQDCLAFSPQCILRRVAVYCIARIAHAFPIVWFNQDPIYEMSLGGLFS